MHDHRRTPGSSAVSRGDELDRDTDVVGTPGTWQTRKIKIGVGHVQAVGVGRIRCQPWFVDPVGEVLGDRCHWIAPGAPAVVRYVEGHAVEEVTVAIHSAGED